jgi:hypothetical protein
MDAGVTAALVTSGASVIVAIATAIWTRTVQHEASAASRDLEVLKAELEKQSEEARRRFEQEQTTARYRDPLLDAAAQLNDRLRNIQENNFLIYLRGSRRVIALQTTLYRISRYFGILEIIGSDLTFLRLSSPESTEHAGLLISQIGSAFASDAFDREGGFETSRFMVWREEQRAMGELVIDATSGPQRLVGYTTFVHRLSEDAASWFRELETDLDEGDASNSDRLRQIRALLGELVSCLRGDDSD